MSRMRRAARPTAWLFAAGALVVTTSTFAANRVVVDVPLLFSSDAEIRSNGDAMKMTTGVGLVTTGELVLARPLGSPSASQAAWYDWRQTFATGGAGAAQALTVRVEIHGPVAGKGGTLIRSVCLEKAWPQEYRVVQLDAAVASPSGGKTQTSFEEILVLKFRNVLRCATPAP